VHHTPQSRHASGFTLVELVMVILLLSVLAAVAIPNFIDFRKDAKDGATKGSLGAVRSAITIARAAINLKEDPTVPTPKYPTAREMWANAFTASHPNLSGTNILDPAAGVPKNPWTTSSKASAFHNTMIDALGSGASSRNAWFGANKTATFG
jgi:prepilin-type N-terminal cleavage/methylation domain-containing protein